MPRLVDFHGRDFVVCVLLAVVVAAALIAAAIMNPPWLHVLPSKWQDFLLFTFLLLIGAVYEYRRTWASKGYWALLLLSLGVHLAAWVSVLNSLQEPPPRLAYVLFAAIEAMLFVA